MDFLLGYMLVLTRVMAAVIVAPLFTSRTIPWSIRISGAFFIALAVAPTVQIPVFASLNWMGIAKPFVGELMLGLIFGGGVSLVFSAFFLVGETLAHITGLRWAQLGDHSDEHEPTSRLLWGIGITVYILCLGPELMVMAISDTFEKIPVGTSITGIGQVELLIILLQQSLWLAIKGMGPAIASYYSGVIVTSMIGRVLPQFSLFFASMNVNAILFWMALLLTVSGGIWVMNDEVMTSIARMGIPLGR